MKANHWQTRDRILQLQNPWLTLIGEHLQDTHGTVLEYWRVEKADSVIILPMQKQRLILPLPTYRPGLGKPTWDFPGGRCPADQRPEQAAVASLQRELDLPAAAIARLLPLNQQGWAINSSFSNQRLYGFVADLKSEAMIPAARIAATYPANATGIQALLEVLQCLQCRLVLREWQARQMEARSS